MLIRTISRIVGVAFVAALFLSAASPAAAKPNIIYIMVDDLGYGDLGCYGQKRIKTPNIDKLAKQGMKFSQFYAGSTVCAPSRCVLMTGLHTGHALIRGNKEIKPMGQWPLPAETVTVAEVLKDAGYTTGLVGKWGLGAPGTEGVPNKQGFDFFYGYLCQRHAHNYYPEFLFRNDKREKLKGNVVNNDREDGAGVATDKVTYAHDLCAKEALAFVDRNRDKPFFLYLSLTIPHANNEGKKEGMEVPDYGQYKNLDWPAPQKGHAAMITRMDKDVGRLMARLKKYGIDDNTIVTFTSDNGPHREGGNDPMFNDSNGPLRGIKRDLYDGGIRVPFIARWPGKIKAGSKSDHIGYFGDFMNTVAELAGTRAPDGLDSISYVPTLLGNGDQKKHEYLYWEFIGGGQHYQAVRYRDWKGIQRYDGGFELYNVANDLGEETNVAKKNPKLVAQIREMIKEAHTPSELFKPRKPKKKQAKK
ncbi:MAG: arylsulfatase [Verrucomicrobiia bacterium]|jgi:arylsulfatase A-like enzyme